MNDCALYGHPNVTGEGCPCGLVVVLRPPTPEPFPSFISTDDWPTPLPPVLAVIRGDKELEQPKAQIRTHRSSLRRPEVWA